MRIYGKTRSGLYAEAEYGDFIVVKAGGKVSKTQKQYLPRKGQAGKYRTNSEYVDEDGIICKDCVFRSLSAAAEFVKGDSTNGLQFWKINEHYTIGSYLKGEKDEE